MVWSKSSARGDNTQAAFRAVLDSNIYVSAYLSGGFPDTVYQLGLRRRYRLVISPQIVLEIRNVLREKFGWTESIITERIRQMVKKADIVRPKRRITMMPHEGDNRLLECAVEGKANFIVTGDRELLRLKQFEGVPIVRAIDFLRILGES
ncbi:MAG: putative toxin-antitoxin system toxin component, PIN family [bacterium]